MELAALIIGFIGVLAAIYPIFILPKLIKSKLKKFADLVENWSEVIGMIEPKDVDVREKFLREKRVENCLSETGLKRYRLKFDQAFRDQFNSSMGYKSSKEYFEKLSYCPEKGVVLSDLWMELKIAMEEFLQHYGEGNPKYGNATIYNRIKVIRMYANG